MGHFISTMACEDPILLLDDKLSRLVVDQSFPIPISCRKFLKNVGPFSLRKCMRQRVSSSYPKRTSSLSMKEIIKKISSSLNDISDYVHSISQMIQKDVDLAPPFIQRYSIITDLLK